MIRPLPQGTVLVRPDVLVRAESYWYAADHIDTAGTILVRWTILVRCDHIGTPGTILIHGGPILVHRTILVPLDHIGTRAPPTPAPTCSEVNVWTYRGVTLGEIDASESFWNASDSHSLRSG